MLLLQTAPGGYHHRWQMLLYSYDEQNFEPGRGQAGRGFRFGLTTYLFSSTTTSHVKRGGSMLGRSDGWYLICFSFVVLGNKSFTGVGI